LCFNIFFCNLISGGKKSCSRATVLITRFSKFCNLYLQKGRRLLARFNKSVKEFCARKVIETIVSSIYSKTSHESSNNIIKIILFPFAQYFNYTNSFSLILPSGQFLTFYQTIFSFQKNNNLQQNRFVSICNSGVILMSSARRLFFKIERSIYITYKIEHIQTVLSKDLNGSYCYLGRIY